MLTKTNVSCLKAGFLIQRINRIITKSNKGKAFFTGLKGLGEMIFYDYESNRKKRIN